MIKIIPDTNTLLLYGEGFDVLNAAAAAIDNKIEIIIPECVLKELENLAKKKGKNGRAAKLAYTIIQQKSMPQPILSRVLFKEIPLKTVPCSKKHADDAIIAIAEDDPARYVVATLDRELQRRLLKQKIRVLTRQQQRFKLKC